MQVSIKSTGNLERQMTIVVPASQIEQAVDKRLSELATKVKVDGFRPGKVPRREIERRFGKDVRQEVIDDLKQSAFYEAIEQEKIQPAGMPSFEVGNLIAGQSLEYTATFEVYPEFEPANFANVTLEKLNAQVTDNDIDNMIEKLRKQHTEWQVVERAAKTEDKLNINFKGTLNGEPFAGGSAEGFEIIIGAKRMIPGFEEGLVGAKVGSDVMLDLTFPEQYHAADLAGKTVQFAIHVNTIAEPKLPEVSEEFLRRLGVEGGVEQLRKELTTNMERELEQALKNKTKTQVMDKLIELNPIEIPKALITSESRRLRQQTIQRMQNDMRNKKLPEIPLELFHDEAKRRVLLGLVLSELIKVHDVKVDDERVKAMIERFAAAYEQPAEVVRWYYSDKERLGEIQALVLEEQIIEKLLDQAKVKEKMVSYDEVMNSQVA